MIMTTHLSQPKDPVRKWSAVKIDYDGDCERKSQDEEPLLDSGKEASVPSQRGSVTKTLAMIWLMSLSLMALMTYFLAYSVLSVSMPDGV